MDYKKILEGVVNIINTTKNSDIGFANICAYISENCPELKESEDERIRKEIIEFVDINTLSIDERHDRWIAWLEKQGEQKSHTWSEEDDQYLLVCKNALRRYQTTDKWDAEIISFWLENKLKAHQTYWKPSDEQMEALWEAYKGGEEQAALASLYSDLKKL